MKEGPPNPTRRTALLLPALFVAGVAGCKRSTPPTTETNTLQSRPTPSDRLTLPELQPELPEAVRDIVPAVVSVIVRANALYSGVLVRVRDSLETYVVTAGHSLRDLNNNPKYETLLCRDTHYITGLTARGEVVTADMMIPDSFTSAMRDDDSVPDISLIHLRTTDPQLPTVPIRETPIEQGEPLYCINWQNDDLKQPRSPEQGHRPVIIGGRADTDTINGGNDVRAFTWRSFGQAGQETHLNPVASGGVVVDTAGRMVGITTGALVDSDGNPITIPRGRRMLSPAVIEPVTANIFQGLVDQLNASPDACTAY